MERYYCPDLLSGRFDEAESRHCGRVMRHGQGDLVHAFDGQGREWKVRLTREEAKRWHFEKLTETVSPAPAVRLILAQAVPKNRAMDLILQKATELGVAEIAPLLSDRVVFKAGEDDGEAKAEKWRETVIEAAKQSGQNWLPLIHPPRRPRDFFPEVARAPLKVIGSLQPEARPLKETLREAPAKPASAVVMIGPEGDFTPAEVGEARAHGFLPVSLGDLVLRSETAALYTLGALKYELM
ncbi:MAG: RsmE family RNA methyltransferase [Verrucomicrobium sp.]|nr:RsmE family RNA methyltransferase [Verrucomicrobium sp.]